MTLGSFFLLAAALVVGFAQDHGAVFHNRTAFDSTYHQFSYFTDSSSILMLLNNGKVHVSHNDGASWEQADVEPISDIVVNPYFTNAAILLTLGQTHYRTTDRGVSWQQFTVPVGFSNFLAHWEVLSFHRDNPDWLIFHGREVCPAPVNGTVLPCLPVDDAYFTLNSGQTWALITTYVHKCVWGRSSEFDVEEDQVFCTEHHTKSGDQGAGGETDFVEYHVLENTRTLRYSYCAGFFTISRFLVIGVFNVNTGLLDLVTSIDGVKFSNVLLPPDADINTWGYTFHESPGSVFFMTIYSNESPGRQLGILLYSNSEGNSFTTSLRNINRYGSRIDMEKMRSLEGVILANEVTNAPQFETKNIQTKISANNGRDWKLLTPPTVDVDGQAIDCEGCSLNLNGPTLVFGQQYLFSAEGAVGLAMAVGNIGNGLSNSELNTFLTNDGGNTWRMVRRGNHLYEFGDMGALIVLVGDHTPTRTLAYSWDEGTTWEDYEFSDVDVSVFVLTTEQGSTQPQFLMYALELQTPSGEESSSMVSITIDFEQLHPRECDDDDFELWSMEREFGVCVNGRKVYYQRRKASSLCYIGREYDPPIVDNSEHCYCTPDDYECDTGFWRNLNGDCFPLDETVVDQEPEDCPLGDKYEVPSGYRKIPGNHCDGGVQLDQPIERLCGNLTCGLDYFTCDNGNCVILPWYCDFINDCLDGSDEGAECDYCQGGSGFECASGEITCISWDLYCNGYPQCEDGSDETDCDPCLAEDAFVCRDGTTCITSAWECDYFWDCPDRSDEVCHACYEPTSFVCSPDNCIWEDWVCDGIDDCQDGSDEVDCGCGDLFYCNVNGECITDDQICNGLADCPDNSDEYGCPTTAPPATSATTVVVTSDAPVTTEKSTASAPDSTTTPKTASPETRPPTAGSTATQAPIDTSATHFGVWIGVGIVVLLAVGAVAYWWKRRRDSAKFADLVNMDDENF
eukprot:Lithocolla_globosa_v1_NODE_1017_length_2950_cov_54.732735.p1 type:complete len:965 gc:universal NODE_1017_length_2950_cov_54.732735:40-2934(+)